MNYPSILRVMAQLYLIVAASAILPFIAALYAGESAQQVSFGILMMLTVLVSASILILVPRPERAAQTPDGLAVAILWWLTVPLFTAFPFVLGAANQSVFIGIHEAVSCLTTTGHSVVEIGQEGWPVSLILWRGILHIMGAVATVTMAASVFAALNLGGVGIHRTHLFTLSDESFFEGSPRLVKIVFSLVLSGVGILFFGLIVTGAPILTAYCDAISALTTGQVWPGDVLAPRAFVTDVILIVGLAFGMLGLPVWLILSSNASWRTFNGAEALVALVILGAFCGLGVVAGLPIWGSVKWSVSALSTSNFLVWPGSDLWEDVPLTILVFPSLIGGGALSACGGVKLARVAILQKRAIREFQQLSYKNSVASFSYQGRALPNSVLIGVWVYLIGYIAAVAFILIVSSFFGAGFSDSVRLSIGTLSNSGGLVAASQETVPLNGIMGGVSILGMILGRLEILAILPILNLDFWRK